MYTFCSSLYINVYVVFCLISLIYSIVSFCRPIFFSPLWDCFFKNKVFHGFLVATWGCVGVGVGEVVLVGITVWGVWYYSTCVRVK